ncbi:MAG: hypothetical protein AAGJ40_09190 [Planctomycetota bacterium]
MADKTESDDVAIRSRGVMGRERACVDRLFEIIEADNDYFIKSRKLALLKIRGPVEDVPLQSVQEAYEKAMRLRHEFTDDHGGLFADRIKAIA